MLGTSVADGSISAILRNIFTRESADPSIIVTHGFGIRVSVRDGQLEVKDGVADYERIRKYPKVDRSLQRIVITNPAGYISLESLRWCADHGVSIAVMNPDAELITSFTADTEVSPSLLRQQIYSSDPESATAIEITRELLTRKITGQGDNTRSLFNDLETTASLYAAVNSIQESSATRDMLDIEARAARDYFATWFRHVVVNWDRKSSDRVPANWVTPFPGRDSLLHNGHGSHHRFATDPVNAALNYAYTLGYHESRIACISHGLNPTIGYAHADKPSRDSLALDILEVIRPVIDAYVIDLFRSQVFSRHQFTEPYGFPPGTCRLVAPLTHEIAEESYSWHKPASDAVSFIKSVLTGHDGRLGQHNKRNVIREKLEFTSQPVTVEDILPDKQWSMLMPFVPESGRTALSISDRRVLAAILHLERHGKPWAFVPPSLGVSAKTLRKRRQDWERSGHWPELHAKIRELASS